MRKKQLIYHQTHPQAILAGGETYGFAFVAKSTHVTGWSNPRDGVKQPMSRGEATHVTGLSNPRDGGKQPTWWGKQPTWRRKQLTWRGEATHVTGWSNPRDGVKQLTWRDEANRVMGWRLFHMEVLLYIVFVAHLTKWNSAAVQQTKFLLFFFPITWAMTAVSSSTASSSWERSLTIRS